MSFEASIQDTSANSETGSGSATLRFRREQIGAGVSREGRLRPGGQLRIEYDPRRLMPEYLGGGMPDIVCHVRFYPGGKERSGTLQLPAGAASGAGQFEAIIPPGTGSVEIWFERREGTAATGWDSRYGQNYRFAVTPSGLPMPDRTVVLRPEAIVDPTRVRVVEQEPSPGREGGVTIRAQIDAASASLAAWADIHVFDATDDLIHSGSITLRQSDARPTGSRVLAWEAAMYQGSGVGVWFRPDAHTVQYRLYCQVADTLYTDGVLHQFEVPAEAEADARPRGSARAN
jgi:hypothetical protein